MGCRSVLGMFVALQPKCTYKYIQTIVGYKRLRTWWWGGCGGGVGTYSWA